MAINFSLSKISTVTLFVSLVVFSEAARSEVVHICDDEAGWPPFVYSSLVGGVPDPSQPMGATVEFLDAIFKEIGVEHTLELLPWKRCLTEVKAFAKSRKYEIFANGSYSDARAKTYHVSLPLYDLSSGIFYSTKRFPEGIEINKLEDIKQYSICGVHGYTYELWGLKDDELIHRARSSEAALKLVKDEECDVFPSNIIPIYGSMFVGKSIVPKDISATVVDFIPHPNFHIYISRGSERGEKLLKQVNDAIEHLQEDGTHAEIYGRYYKKIGRTFTAP